ncbi:MAG: hypothetical protein OXE99_08820 [Cellvibrionales bacterium]|nr:hypothetical protein [Cellvibrionales bacterium]
MMINKDFKKGLCLITLFMAIFGQNTQATPIAIFGVAQTLKIALALGILGQNSTFRENIPGYAKVQDYALGQVYKGASVVTNAAYNTVSETAEGIYMQSQIALNKDTTFTSAPMLDIDIDHELAEVNTKTGKVLRQSDKTLSNKTADILNMATGGIFRGAERKENAKYIWVNVNEANPVVSGDDVFYDAHPSKNNEPEAIKPEPATSNSGWGLSRLLPSYLLF